MSQVHLVAPQDVAHAKRVLLPAPSKASLRVGLPQFDLPSPRLSALQFACRPIRAPIARILLSLSARDPLQQNGPSGA